MCLTLLYDEFMPDKGLALLRRDVSYHLTREGGREDGREGGREGGLKLCTMSSCQTRA